MRLSEFIVLNEEEKRLTVLHKGVLIAKRGSHNHLVFLFQLGSYYVETWCNTENKAIEEFRAFDSTKPLHPYLQAISIEDMLNR